jgi:hypothetical protein
MEENNLFEEKKISPTDCFDAFISQFNSRIFRSR